MLTADTPQNTDTTGILEEMVRDCAHTTGDGQRLWKCYMKWSETPDILKVMVRDHGHITGDGQRLQTSYRRE